MKGSFFKLGNRLLTFISGHIYVSLFVLEMQLWLFSSVSPLYFNKKVSSQEIK